MSGVLYSFSDRPRFNPVVVHISTLPCRAWLGCTFYCEVCTSLRKSWASSVPEWYLTVTRQFGAIALRLLEGWGKGSAATRCGIMEKASLELLLLFEHFSIHCGPASVRLWRLEQKSFVEHILIVQHESQCTSRCPLIFQNGWHEKFILTRHVHRHAREWRRPGGTWIE